MLTKSTLRLLLAAAFFALAAMTSLAPSDTAEAAACHRCRFFVDHSYCINSSFGWTECVTTSEGCQISGTSCP